MSSGIGRRCGSDLAMLWLCRLAAAAPIQFLGLGTSVCHRCGPKKKKKKKTGSYQLLVQFEGARKLNINLVGYLQLLMTSCGIEVRKEP